MIKEVYISSFTELVFVFSTILRQQRKRNQRTAGALNEIVIKTIIDFRELFFLTLRLEGT